MATKYWIAGNPNGQVTDEQVQSLKALSVSDLAEVESLLGDIPMTAETNVAVTQSAGPVTADGSVTIANGAAPSNDEIYELAVETVTKLNALLTKLRATGLLA